MTKTLIKMYDIKYNRPTFTSSNIQGYSYYNKPNKTTKQFEDNRTIDLRTRVISKHKIPSKMVMLDTVVNVKRVKD